MNNLLWLIYTHEEYDDVFEITLKRIIKHCPPGIKYAVATNNIEHIKNKYNNFNFHALYKYDDTQPYGERLNTVLSKIPEKYIILNHEHDIMVNNLNIDMLYSYIKVMEDKSIDQLRLSVSGIENPSFDKEIGLYKINGPYFISLITSLWKKDSLLSIVCKFSSHTFRCFECPEIQEYVSKLNNYYLSSNKDTPFIGEGHYFSYYFPYVHCTSGGKWRTSTPTIKKYIDEIVDEYNIDISKRGKC